MPMATRTRLVRLGLICGLVLGLSSACGEEGFFRSGPPTPTAIRAVVPPSELTEEAVSAPLHEGGPLRFNLPTPGPMPVSLWRPALYEVPWALSPYDHFYFTRPIAADEVNWPIADYRYGGIFFSSDIVHTGVDIPTPKGTPVLAAGPGKVVWAGYGLYFGNNNPDDPYGLAVTIRHDFGYRGERLYTVYAHLDTINVVNGQIVQTGDVLGEVGTTGLTTGPHLHFEVRMERNSYFSTLNPELWLAPPQGWGVLVGQLRKTDAAFLIEHEVRVKNLETGQKWSVRTYGNSAVNSDTSYRENMVLSDLPGGPYEITLDYENTAYTYQTTIYPGAVTYFTYRGEFGFLKSQLPTPDVEELLPTISP